MTGPKQLKKIILAWRLRRDRKVFERLLGNPQSGIHKMMNEYAQGMAMQMVTNWLDRKRILHCKECPGTETLRKLNGFMYCPGHYSHALTKHTQHETAMAKAAKEKQTQTVTNEVAAA